MKTRIFALGLAVLLVFTMLAGCSDGNSGAPGFVRHGKINGKAEAVG